MEQEPIFHNVRLTLLIIYFLIPQVLQRIYCVPETILGGDAGASLKCVGQ